MRWFECFNATLRDPSASIETNRLVVLYIYVT